MNALPLKVAVLGGYMFLQWWCYCSEFARGLSGTSTRATAHFSVFLCHLLSVDFLFLNSPTYGRLFSNVAHRLPFFPPFLKEEFQIMSPTMVALLELRMWLLWERNVRLEFYILSCLFLILLKDKTCNFIVTLCMFFKGAASPTVLQFLPSCCRFLPTLYYWVHAHP